jgi:hypothetical protein
MGNDRSSLVVIFFAFCGQKFITPRDAFMNQMLDAGFWMPVEDPVFRGDNIWNLFFYVSSIQYQASSISLLNGRGR